MLNTKNDNAIKEALEEAKTGGEIEPTVEVTQSQLKQMIQDAVASAVAPKPRERMRNTDLALAAAGPAVQLQEEVDILSASTGGSSRGRNQVPAVPEFVVDLDLSEHRPILDKIRALGYVVSLDRLEWRVRFEPTERKLTESGRMADVVVEREEPIEKAQPLIDQLEEADPRYSRVWLKHKLGPQARTIANQQSLMEAVANDGHMTELAGGGAQEALIGRLEAGDLSQITAKDMDVSI